MAVGQNEQPRARRLLQAAQNYTERGWYVFPLHALRRGGGCTCGKEDCNSPAKHPRTSAGLKDASRNSHVLVEWWRQWPTANVAILTGNRSDLIVVDVDPHHGGENALATLQERYGALPETLRALTGGGGVHHLFRYPAKDLLLRNATKLDGLRGLDVRADGGYIVAAPSLHVSGAYYAWDESSSSTNPELSSAGDLSIAVAPDWLVEVLSRPRGGLDRPAAHGVHDSRPNDGTNGSAIGQNTSVPRIARYYLDRALERASEGTRNDTGFWLALQLRDAGLAEGEAMAYLAEYAASVPGTGYSEREAVASLRQAYRAAPRAAAIPRSARADAMTGLYAPDVATMATQASDPAYAYTAGADTLYGHNGASSGERWGQQQQPDERGQSQQQQQSSPDEPTQDTHDGLSNAEGNADTANEQRRRSRFRFMTDEEVEMMQPPEWLMDGILPEKQLAVVYGEWGSCKSFLVQDWALSIATGESWMGKHAVKQGVVAYIAGEGIGGMGRRIRAWKRHHGWEGPTGLYLVGQAPQLLQPGDVSDLVAALDELPAPPAAIILDTLARSLVGGDENSAKDMGFAIAAADMLRVRFGALVILVHHKPAGATKTRGSTALPGAASTQIVVTKDGDRVIVACDKQKEAAQFRPIHLRTMNVSLSDDDPDDNSLVLIPATIDPTQPVPSGLPASAEALLQLIRNGSGADVRTLALEKQWCDLTGQSKRNFYNALTTISKNRLARKVGEFWMVNRDTTSGSDNGAEGNQEGGEDGR